MSANVLIREPNQFEIETTTTTGEILRASVTPAVAPGRGLEELRSYWSGLDGRKGNGNATPCIDIPFNLVNGSVTSKDGTVPMPKLPYVTVSLRPAEAIRTYVMLDGGWALPGPWLATPNLLIDRNIASCFQRTAELGATPEDDYLFWLLDMAAARLYLLPAAIEGNQTYHDGRPPLLNDIARELAHLFSVSTAWGRAPIVTPLEASVVEGLLAMFHQFHASASLFLRQSWPLIATPPRDTQERDAGYRRILSAAGEAQLKNSVLLTLALAAYFSNGDGNNPARRLFQKFKGEPTESRIYNVVADVWHFIVLVGLNSGMPGSWGFLTQDRGLVGCWASLRPRDFYVEAGHPGCTLTVDKSLFPSLSVARLQQLKQDCKFVIS